MRGHGDYLSGVLWPNRKVDSRAGPWSLSPGNDREPWNDQKPFYQTWGD